MMDFDVSRTAPGHWVLTDLLGRPAGHIGQLGPRLFRFAPVGQSGSALREVASHTFESLDNVLRAVEIVSRGSCHLKP